MNIRYKTIIIIGLLALFMSLLASNVSAIDDYAPPDATITIDVTNGVNVSQTGNISVYVTDNTAINIVVNISVNGIEFWNASIANPGTAGPHTFNLSSNWINTISVRVEDEDDNSAFYNETYTIYITNCFIVNEEDGSAYDYSDAQSTGNLTEFNLFCPSTSQILDMLSEEYVNFTYVTDDKYERIRFEQVFANTADSVIRSFAISLLAPTINLGFIEIEQSFFENLVYSSASKAAVVNNLVGNCTIFADYTSYAGTNQYTASIITINMIYYLYTVQDDEQVTLASIEGSRSALINLDFLDYDEFDIDFSLLSDQLSIVPYSNKSVVLVYLNLNEDNAKMQIDIYDNATLIFNYIETNNPNEFLVYFDWTIISLTDDLLEVRITVTKEDGTTDTFTKYFSVSIAEYQDELEISAEVIVVLSVGLVLFGLTFVSSNQVFGFFGIIILSIGIALTTLSSGDWYVTFLQAIFIVLLLFAVLIARAEGVSKVI